MHKNLTIMRKRYDEVKRVQQLKEQEMVAMKRQCDLFDQEEALMNGTKGDTHKELQQEQQELDSVKNRFEKVWFDKKTLEQMLLRCKQDDISYQLRAQRLEKELAAMEGEVLRLQGESGEHLQMGQQSQLVLNRLVSNIYEDQGIRQDQEAVLTEAVCIKEQHVLRMQEHAHKQREVAETAAYEMKYSNEEKWRNLLMVHKYLQMFLKTKMARIYSHYQKTEKGYARIRQCC